MYVLEYTTNLACLAHLIGRETSKTLSYQCMPSPHRSSFEILGCVPQAETASHPSSVPYVAVRARTSCSWKVGDDALPHRRVPATFPHGFPIDDPTNVPELDAKRTLLYPFNEVVSYETYRLKDKRSGLYACE